MIIIKKEKYICSWLLSIEAAIQEDVGNKALHENI